MMTACRAMLLASILPGLGLAGVLHAADAPKAKTADAKAAPATLSKRSEDPPRRGRRAR